MLTFLAMANVVLTLSLWRFQWGALPKMGWVTPMTLGPTGFVTAIADYFGIPDDAEPRGCRH